MNIIERLKSKIINILTNEDPDVLRYDKLQQADPDYLLNSPLVVGYNTTQEQYICFQHLLIGFNPVINSILDIGCGRGDLYKFILDFYDIKSINYFGIDLNPLMKDIAQNKHNLDIKTGSYENVDLNPKDWVVASRLFTEKKLKSEGDELERVLNEIDILYNISRKVVSFNILSPINNNKKQDHWNYISPSILLDILIEKYQYVTIKHNYSDFEYTIIINKY